MRWVPTTSDLLIVAFLIGVALIAFGEWRSAERRRPWLGVAARPSVAVAVVVLAAYVGIGLADSLRFEWPRAGESPRVATVLDRLLEGRVPGTETSYSAPLATHALSAESRPDAAGPPRRERPRLAHGGVHLNDPVADWAPDVRARLLGGATSGALGMLAALLVPAAAVALLRGAAGRAALARILRGRGRFPWLAGAAALILLATVAGAVLQLSAGYHVLGTDKVGQDVLLQSLKSIRTGLLIGTLTTFVTLPLALGLGLAAGYFRGWVDDLVQYLYTTLNSIPGVLLIAASVLVLDVQLSARTEGFASLAERADLRLLALCLILGMTSWTGLCRLLRAETLKLRELEFVQAGRVLGTPDWRILLRHVLPNVLHLVIIAVVLDFSGLVLAEAVLSYVSIGVDPTMNSWGNMINGARLELAREPVVWWSLASAFGFMLALVLAANVLGDAVRDAFDPRMQRA